MANGADAIKNVATLREKLTGASIGAEAAHKSGGFVGPNVVVGLAGVRAHAGKNEIHHIHIAIAIGIIFGVVHAIRRGGLVERIAHDDAQIVI